jgi:uncharacterized protein (TIGR01777 family)
VAAAPVLSAVRRRWPSTAVVRILTAEPIAWGVKRGIAVMRVFVAGGSGQVGSRLVPALLKNGDQVVVLTRNMTKAREKLGPGPEIVEGDPLTPGSWMNWVNGCDAVVNLVGEGVFNRRWRDSFKALIRDSRVKSTTNIVEAIRRATDRPSVLVNGSAIGYYGFHGDELLTEDSPPGDDFLAKVCVEWEQAARPVEALRCRLVLLRTGVVLDKAGGALRKMILPFKLFVGGKIGSGKQWVSWIHHDDEVGLIQFALETDEVRGPLNATAPVPVTNKQFAKALGKALWRPSWFPTPRWLLRLVLGEVADLVTKGQRVLPKRAQELGYAFKFPDIHSALRDIFAKPPPLAAPAR